MTWVLPLLMLLAAAEGSAARYAFGGEPVAVAAEAGTAYRLAAAGATVAQGRVDDDGRAATPAVRGRLRCALTLGGEPAGDVVLLPADARPAALGGGLDVAVVGPADSAAARLLPGARGVDRPAALRLSRPDAVVVADGASEDVAVLDDLADAGTVVLVLPQRTGGEAIVGALTWKDDPLVARLLNTLAAEDLQPAGPLFPTDSGVALATVADADPPAAVVVRRGNLIRWQLPLDEARLTLLLDAALAEAGRPAAR